MKTVYISNKQSKLLTGLKELLAYKDLIIILIHREFKIRYKQTLIGGMWAIFQPLASMIIFTLIFDKIMKLDSGEVPYPVFSYCALVPWTFFNHSLTKSTRSLVENRALITKIYFPRLVIPISTILASLIDLFVALSVLFILLFIYQIPLSWKIFLLPFFVLMAALTALSFGLWLSALNVEYRDVINILPFILQSWLFITPVAYSTKIIPDQFQLLMAFNPMTGVVEGFRWALIGSTSPPLVNMIVSFAILIFTLIGGLLFFKNREHKFADVI